MLTNRFVHCEPISVSVVAYPFVILNSGNASQIFHCDCFLPKMGGSRATSSSQAKRALAYGNNAQQAPKSSLSFNSMHFHFIFTFRFSLLFFVMIIFILIFNCNESVKTHRFQAACVQWNLWAKHLLSIYPKCSTKFHAFITLTSPNLTNKTFTNHAQKRIKKERASMDIFGTPKLNIHIV